MIKGLEKEGKLMKRIFKIKVPFGGDLYNAKEAEDIALEHAIKIADEYTETNEFYNEYTLRGITRDLAATEEYIYFADVYYFHVSTNLYDTKIL